MRRAFLLSLGIIAILSCTSCEDLDNETPIIERITIDNITLPEGFTITKLYQPMANNQGSWVSITKDDQGCFYTSDQYGSIYKSTLINSPDKPDSLSVEKLDVSIGRAQGLLWHKKVLYALVNSIDKTIESGLYKVYDSTGGRDLNAVKQLKAIHGEGEHGPHNIVLSPDETSLFLVFGNHTDIPSDVRGAVPDVWHEDNLLPVIKDPSGHANDRMAPGGWVARTDLEGEHWTLINVGTRNTYDLAFNRDGELFGFDSDMEYDMGMPWYRPIRLNHMTTGADYGWRTGTGKFKDFYPDNLPGIANLGQGSPTGVVSGSGLKFPAYYQKGLFLFDWSYGTIYHAKLSPQGSTYEAQITEFLSGIPLPLTNGIVGSDGALYFLTGGRRLESGFYRVKYEGTLHSEILNLKERSKGKKQRRLRQQLEALHLKPSETKLPFILKYLDHEERFIRFAARIALEHLDYELWKDKIQQKYSITKTIALAIAIARHGNDIDRLKAMDIILAIDWSTLKPTEKTDFIRGLDLLLVRMQRPLPNHQSERIKETLLPSYLTETNAINEEVCKILSYIQASEIIAPTLDVMETDSDTESMKALYLSGDITQRSEQYGKDVEQMLHNMPNAQHISYAKSLSYLGKGWTPDLRERYFIWYGKALQKAGGKMYTKFIKAIREQALSYVPEDSKAYLLSLSEIKTPENLNEIDTVKQPVGPGLNWTVELLMSAYEANKTKADIAHGKKMFRATLCVACHSIKGEGGSSGPELTKIGSRFSVGDIGEAIVNPSGTIGDRYRYSNYYMKDGSVVTGIIINKDETTLELSTNAFSLDSTIEIKNDSIVKVEPSPISPMPPGLINSMNAQELTDLIAYMLSAAGK
ncbi:c-type cytochrome [Snuella sedimenti]|uniref:C-type cytochrome n=1 Tax=Snuella sedimenti TaxID=2798802 RepID=A0A8J7JDQ8_9FLAO|nr:c-type cytochrome [Snuella sedimenti]MBJ6369259.1 c-type cytochrome [Snuella sedimenti]